MAEMHIPQSATSRDMGCCNSASRFSIQMLGQTETLMPDTLPSAAEIELSSRLAQGSPTPLISRGAASLQRLLPTDSCKQHSAVLRYRLALIARAVGEQADR